MAVTDVGPQPVLVVRAGEGKGTLVNRDLVNSVAIGPDNSIGAGNPNSASILDALVGIPVDGKSNIYACTLAQNQQVQCDFIKHAEAWNPSPKMSAQQLAAAGLALDTSVNNPAFGPAKDATVGTVATNTAGVAKDTTVTGLNTGIPNNIASTGVPLLTKSTLVSSGGSTLAASATSFTANLPISQLSYDVAISVEATAGTVGAGAVLVTFFWKDSTSGNVVAQQSWCLTGASSPSFQNYIGSGPTYGDQLVIEFANQDTTASVTFSYRILQHSRVSANGHDWQQQSSAAIPNFTNANYQQDMGLLLGVQVAVAISGQFNRAGVLSPGMANIQAVLTAPGTIIVEALGLSLTSSQYLYHRQITAAGGGEINDQFALPRSVFALVFTNGATGQTPVINIWKSEFRK